MHEYIKIRGVALVYVMAVIAAASILFAGTIRFVVSHVKYNTSLEPNTQALHVSEAGIYFYRWYLAHNVEGKTATQISNFWENIAIGVDRDGGGCSEIEKYTHDYKDEAGNIIGKYEICVTPPKKYSTVLYIESKGTASSSGITQERTIRARLRKPSWSEFAILGNEMIRLSSGTDVYGPMHVNGGFHFDGVAHNIVTSSVETYYDSDGDVRAVKPGVWTSWEDEENDDQGGENVFLAGNQYPVVSQDFNSVTADFDEMRNAAIDLGLYFDKSSVRDGFKIILQNDGTADIYEVSSYNSRTYEPSLARQCTGWGRWRNCSDIDPITVTLPDTGVIYIRNNVWVEGILSTDTRLTIAAHDSRNGRTPRIFIGLGDIYYQNYDTDSVLGLAAEGDIDIVKDDNSLIDGTLHIDAVLLAQKGRVGRDNFAKWYNSDCRDTIELYGAIATNGRMGFGYTGTQCSGSGTGFTNRSLLFDNNLLYSPPPLFPTGNTYAIDLWDEIK